MVKQKKPVKPGSPVKTAAQTTILTPGKSIAQLPFPFNNFLVPGILIIIVCIAVYAKTLSYSYSYHDDNIIVLDNLPFLKDLSNIPEAITMDAWFRHKQIELYRPLQNVSYMIDAQFGNNIIFATRVTNLVLHILSCLAVFYLLTLFRLERKYAFFGSLIYAVHYLFLHAVIWIPARGDLLLSLFSFLSMISFLKILETNKWYFYAANVLFFALALLSKETAIMLPVLFILYLSRFTKRKFITKGNGILAISYVVLFVVFYYLRDLSITKDEQSIGLGPFFLNLRTIPETIIKLFIPLNFSTMPSFKVGATISGLLVITGFIILFIKKKELFNGNVVFGLVWFACFLLPGMVYRPEFASYTYEYLDHRDYLPMFGIILILLSLVREIEVRSVKKSVPSIILAFMIAVLVYLAFQNFRLNVIYRDPLAYSTSAITSNQKCSLGYFIHGNEVYRLGKKNEAYADFDKAVRFYPKFHDARFDRALLLSEQKRYQESLEDLNILLTVKPDYPPKAYNLRGVVKINLGDQEGARKDLETAIQMDPNYPEAQKNLDILMKTMTHRAAAYQSLNESQKLNEDGVTLAKNGDIKEALKLFEKSFAKDPTFYKALVNIGNCKDALGDHKGACEAWKTAADHGNQGGQDLYDKYCK